MYQTSPRTINSKGHNQKQTIILPTAIERHINSIQEWPECHSIASQVLGGPTAPMHTAHNLP
jgi:hypothetical protein